MSREISRSIQPFQIPFYYTPASCHFVACTYIQTNQCNKYTSLIPSVHGRRESSLILTACTCMPIPIKTWESMYLCKCSVNLICHSIHFCIIKRQKVRKYFFKHEEYMESHQCSASLLLLSLSLCSSLCTLPTQKLQLYYNYMC